MFLILYSELALLMTLFKYQRGTFLYIAGQVGQLGKQLVPFRIRWQSLIEISRVRDARRFPLYRRKLAVCTVQEITLCKAFVIGSFTARYNINNLEFLN